MTHEANDDLTKALPPLLGCFSPLSLERWFAVLKDALGDEWVVERLTDYMGEVSIIAFPVAEPFNPYHGRLLPCAPH